MKGTSVVLTAENQRKAMHDSPEALGQWLRDIYVTGLQSNGILLVSGSVFAEFMDAYNRVVLHRGLVKTTGVEAHFDPSVKRSMQQVKATEERLAAHHGLADPSSAPAVDLTNLSDQSVGSHETLDDAFGLSNQGSTVANVNDGEDVKRSPGWDHPSDDEASRDDQLSKNDSDNVQPGPGYGDLDSDVVGSVFDEGLAGNIVEKIMDSGTSAIEDSLTSDVRPQGQEPDEVQPSVHDDGQAESENLADQLADLAGGKDSGAAITTVQHDDGSTSSDGFLFGVKDKDAVAATAESNADLNEASQSVVDEMVSLSGNADVSNESLSNSADSSTMP